MKVPDLARRRIFLPGASGAIVTLALLSLAAFVQAGPPVVSIGANRARIQTDAASLSQVIDALSRAALFKVTYEGARPSAMLFNLEIDTPSVPQTLLRVLEGQNLNYALVLDPSGKTVRTLMILGLAPKAGAATSPPVSGTPRPQPFATPPGTRNTLPPVDDDPEEGTETGASPGAAPGAEPGPPQPGASPSPSPGEVRPVAPAPFGPRSPFGTPIGTPLGTPFGAPPGPRPTPTPTQAPTPSPSA